MKIIDVPFDTTDWSQVPRECERGHVLLVLDGELITELADGRLFTMRAGMSYQVADGASSHRSESPTGARLFIVD